MPLTVTTNTEAVTALRFDLYRVYSKYHQAIVLSLILKKLQREAPKPTSNKFSCIEKVRVTMFSILTNFLKNTVRKKKIIITALELEIHKHGLNLHISALA